jgi:membrane associated rhomboid family serine protease
MKRSPVVTGLIVANVLVFAVLAWRQWTLTFSDPDDFLVLLFTGANFNPLTLGGQPWRLLSSMFMHANAIHLLVNMMALYNIGSVLEEKIGSTRILVIYMIAGIAGGLASLVFNLFLASVGASGAIFGIYGYLLLSEIVENYYNREALQSILISFAIFLVVTYLLAQQANVDNAAHAGGFAAGLILAAWHTFTKRRSLFLLFVILFISPVALLIVPKGQLRYFELFQRVIRTEERLDGVKRQNLDNGPFLDSLKTLSVSWDSLKRDLDSLSSVPPGLMHDTSVMASYIALRKREVDYHIRWIERESYIYRDSLEVTYAALNDLPRFEHPLGLRAPKPGEQAAADSVQKKEPAHEPIQVFYDSNWVETDNHAAARYFRLGWRDSLGRWQGDVRDYYISGKIQMKGRYTDNMHDGVFLYYSEEDHYESAGRYEREDPVGKWEYYYPNGRLHREVVYAGRTFTRSVYDTAGVAQVVNGNGRQVTWHATGAVSEEGAFENGLRQGLWRGFYADGKPYFEEYYRDNRLERGRSLDVHGNKYVYDVTSLLPYPESGMPAYRQYLRSGVKMSGLGARGEVVKLVFTVDRDGSVRDFVVLDKGCTGCAEEAIRLVKAGVRWRPALLRGQERVQAQAYLEVEF